MNDLIINKLLFARRLTKEEASVELLNEFVVFGFWGTHWKYYKVDMFWLDRRMN